MELTLGGSGLRIEEYRATACLPRSLRISLWISLTPCVPSAAFSSPLGRATTIHSHMTKYLMISSGMAEVSPLRNGAAGLLNSDGTNALDVSGAGSSICPRNLKSLESPQDFINPAYGLLMLRRGETSAIPDEIIGCSVIYILNHSMKKSDLWMGLHLQRVEWTSCRRSIKGHQLYE